MSQINLYFISVAISILLGVGVSLFLRKSLFALLVDICGTQDRARFWLHITILSYILVATAIGLAFQPEITHVQGFTEFSDGVVHEERIYYEMADYDPMIYSFGGQLGKTLFKNDIGGNACIGKTIKIALQGIIDITHFRK